MPRLAARQSADYATPIRPMALRAIGSEQFNQMPKHQR
jgi:hypothetical protein